MLGIANNQYEQPTSTMSASEVKGGVALMWRTLVFDPKRMSISEKRALEPLPRQQMQAKSQVTAKVPNTKLLPQ